MGNKLDAENTARGVYLYGNWFVFKCHNCIAAVDKCDCADTWLYDIDFGYAIFQEMVAPGAE